MLTYRLLDLIIENRKARGLNPFGPLCPDKDTELQGRRTRRKYFPDNNLDTEIAEGEFFSFPIPKKGLFATAKYDEKTGKFKDAKYALAKRY